RVRSRGLQGGEAGELLALEELEGGAAAGGDVGDGVQLAGAGERGDRVAAADDGRAGAGGERGGDGQRAVREGVALEYGHRPVPERGAGGRDLGGVRLRGGGPDVDPQAIGRERVRRHDLRLRARLGPVGNQVIDRQADRDALRPRARECLTRELDAVVLDA